jgi:hypothetical protein
MITRSASFLVSLYERLIPFLQMIDTDLYLLPAMKHYFLELPQGKNRAPQFLARNATLQNGTYGEILNR